MCMQTRSGPHFLKVRETASISFTDIVKAFWPATVINDFFLWHFNIFYYVFKDKQNQPAADEVRNNTVAFLSLNTIDSWPILSALGPPCL
jgi:hypothetical protein